MLVEDTSSKSNYRYQLLRLSGTQSVWKFLNKIK